MASILKQPSGRWRAQVRLKGETISDTFARRQDAQDWAIDWKDLRAKMGNDQRISLLEEKPGTVINQGPSFWLDEKRSQVRISTHR